MQDEIRKFYQSFSGKRAEPLEQDDPRYVPLLEEHPGIDPILKLWKRIDLAESESVHLLTGYRGNGKSTELKRLKKLLEDESQCTVFLVDMFDYVFMTKPIEISDFILSLMAALSSLTEKQTGFAGLTSFVKDRWEKFVNFLNSEIEIDNIDIKLPVIDLGARLKTDPLFKERIQKYYEGRITRLISEANKFVASLVEKIQDGNQDHKVVLLVDSLEQLRGVGKDAKDVHDSVVELFSGQARNLSFSRLHIVYTIPPYLQVLAPNLGRTLGGYPVTKWPNIHVRNKAGKSDETGLNLMKRLVEKRFPAWSAVISLDLIYKFAECSGGDIRNFFRLLREAAISLMIAREKNNDAILTAQMVDRVIQQLKNELLPIAEEDARWLAKIHESKDPSLRNVNSSPDLARFLDCNLIMNYLNGEEWCDVHPLLVDEIMKPCKEKD